MIMTKKLLLAILALANLQPLLAMDAPTQKDLDAELIQEGERIYMGKNYEKIEQLLIARANPNIKVSGRTSLLMSAICHRNLKLCRLLIEHKADTNAKETRFGCTPLMWAAQGSPIAEQVPNSLEICELLLKNNADVHTKDNLGGTAWQSAKRNGQTAICELLEKHGAEVKELEQDSSGENY